MKKRFYLLKSSYQLIAISISLVCHSAAYAQKPKATETTKTVESIAVRYAGLRDLVLIVLENHPELGQAEAESRLVLKRQRPVPIHNSWSAAVTVVKSKNFMKLIEITRMKTRFKANSD